MFLFECWRIYTLTSEDDVDKYAIANIIHRNGWNSVLTCDIEITM